MRRLREILLAATLGAAPAALAHEDVAKLKIHGSETNYNNIKRLETLFKKTAGVDTLIISRTDIMSAAEIKQSQLRVMMGMPLDSRILSTMQERTDRVYEQYGDLFPENNEVLTEEDRKNAEEMLYKWAHGQALAARLTKEKDGTDLCVIIAPDADESPQETLRSVAGLPADMASMLRTKSSSRNFYELVMFHEAAHCHQDQGEGLDALSKAIHSLNNEIEADKTASDTYKNLSWGAKQAVTEFRHARAIANIRNSVGLIQTQQQHLSHGTRVYDTGYTLDGKKVETSDIMLASLVLGHANNLLVSAVQYEIGSSLSGKPEFEKFISDNPILKRSSHHEKTGIYLTNAYPLIQYAGIRTLKESLEMMPGYAEGNKKRVPAIVHKMMADYINGFDALFPAARNHPMVLKHLEIAKTMLTPEAIKKVAISMDLQNEKKDGTRTYEDVLKACMGMPDSPDNSLGTLKALEKYEHCKALPLRYQLQPHQR